MKLNPYNQPNLAYGLPKLEDKKTPENSQVGDPNKPTTLPSKPDGEVDGEKPPAQETILEGIQRVKKSMDELRYNREMTVGDKDQQLKPLQKELDELVNDMQLAIKDFAAKKTNELFGMHGLGTDKKVGTLFDFIA